MSVGRRWVVAVLTIVLGVSVAASFAPWASSDGRVRPSEPTKGRVPNEAFLPNGEVNLELVPDFVAVWDDDGSVIAGYVAREYLFPEAGGSAGGPSDAVPVYADDLATLVGHLIDDKGFVPLEIDPGMVPTAPSDDGP